MMEELISGNFLRDLDRSDDPRDQAFLNKICEYMVQIRKGTVNLESFKRDVDEYFESRSKTEV